MKRVWGRARVHPWLASSLAVLVLAAAGLGTYFGVRDDKAAAATAATTTQTVATGTVRQSVSATGTLAPASQEELNFTVSGEVTSVAAAEGKAVKKGQALATVDSAALAADVAQAQASVANDQAKVDDDGSNDATDTQVAADKAALTAAQNQLTSAKNQLAAATLRSPIDGVVASVNLTVGQSVSGSGSSGSSGSGSSGSSGSGGAGGADSGSSGASGSDSSSSDPQILVISTNSWVVNATVDASSVNLIKKGNQAQLTVTGATATVYGTVASIGLVSSSTSGTASYPVVVDVTGSPTGLHDGADVTATLIYKQLSDVLVAPTTAIHRNADGGQYVERIKNGKTEQATVKTGISSGGQTQIVSGLAAGDQIVVPQVRIGGGTTPRGGTQTGFPGRGQFPGGGQLPGGGGVLPGGGGGAVQLPQGGTGG